MKRAIEGLNIKLWKIVQKLGMQKIYFVSAFECLVQV